MGNYWRKLRPYRADITIALFLAAAATAAAWILTGLQDHIATLNNPKADDVWFEGDPARVFVIMTDRGGDHSRSNKHPLFSLLTLTYRYLCGGLFNLSPLETVRVSIASTAAVWMALFYVLLRLLGCRKPDSALFSLLAATSAAAIFWTAIPETYLLGSLTIIAVLVVAAVAERRRIPPWLDVGMAAGALAITVTNWMFALASLITRHRITRAIQLASNSFVVIVLLMGIQKALVPSAAFLFDYKGEARAFVHPDALTTLKVFFLHSMVMPDISSVPQNTTSLWPLLSIQQARSWNLTLWGPIALAAWVALLVAGVWTVATMKSLERFRMTVVLTLMGQFALHLVYGSETFLYALDWLPLLIVTTALACQSRLRPLVLAAATILVVAAFQHNYAEFRFALDTVAASAAVVP